jgi:predicted dehydrogenase
MHILFFGLGSIGQRHLRLIQEHYPNHKVMAFRTGLGQETNSCTVEQVRSWDAVDAFRPDIAFITNPTHLHIETALECVRRGMHLFIEKPIGSGLSGLDELILEVQKKKLTTYIAYPLRFHPVVVALKDLLKGKKVFHSRVQCTSYLPDWRPHQSQLKSYSASKSGGGGVLLDVSHDIDYIEYLFGPLKFLSGEFGKKSDITLDAEDWADLIATHFSGRTSIHLNIFSRKTQRYIEVDCEEAFLRADLIRNTLTSVSCEGESVQSFTLSRDDLFTNQLRYFFENIGNLTMMNSLEQAAELFKKIIALRSNQ